jgi:hypothetical protein
MNLRRLILGIVGCGMFGVTGSDTLAGDAGPLRLYEVTTATSMPHLDESLRYATRTETRCIDTRNLSGEFWMLREVSLQDCRLVKASESADAQRSTRRQEHDLLPAHHGQAHRQVRLIVDA